MGARRLVVVVMTAAAALAAPAAMAKAKAKHPQHSLHSQHSQHSPAKHAAHATHSAVISDPDWVRMPKGAELARLYPQAAAAEHVAGRTKALCHVLANGDLDACVVTEECPRGYGFGRATLLAAQDFQMRPRTVNGVPVDGGTVMVPMVWALDGSTPRTCGPAAR
jgi:TonB family protein